MIKYPEEIKMDHIERQLNMKTKGKYWPQVKGKSGSFETWVEIPITVHYDFQPPERETRDEPGFPAAVCVSEIDLPEKIEDYIMSNYMDSLEQECWEDLDD